MIPLHKNVLVRLSLGSANINANFYSTTYVKKKVVVTLFIYGLYLSAKGVIRRKSRLNWLDRKSRLAVEGSTSRMKGKELNKNYFPIIRRQLGLTCLSLIVRHALFPSLVA